MTTEPSGRCDGGPRGTKRRSNSPPPWQRLQKVPRANYEKTGPSTRWEAYTTTDRLHKDQVRLNQIQEDERSREWVAQEDDFVLKQAKKKAEIRIKDGRAKPIDWLAVALRIIDTTRDPLDDEYDSSAIDVIDPNKVLDGLSEDQISELEKEIDTFLRLEKNAQNKDYWRAMKLVCRDRRKKSAPDPEGRAVSSVSLDIDRLLSPKSYEELEALELQIKGKLESNEPIDTDYWEQLLKSLHVWKAKAKVKKVYQSVLDSRSSALPQQSNAEAGNVRESLQSLVNDKESTSNGLVMTRGDSLREEKKEPPEMVDVPRTGHVPLDSSSGRFAALPNEDFSQATRALYEKEVARGISENEEIFTGEEDVDTKSKVLWSGKYRPRKPRYFNRVQMGYEWNKYNQTHYDHDNPPPKVVQGYKFNIFYPDLIDRTKAPTYKIEREGGRKKGQSFAPAGEEDTCLIRFISGPPYEDVAFRIVDKEWDYSAIPKSIFRNSPPPLKSTKRILSHAGAGPTASTLDDSGQRSNSTACITCNDSAHRVLFKLASFLPGLVALLVAVILLALIGAGVAAILRRILTSAKFDERMSRNSTDAISDWSPSGSPTLLVARIAFWACVVLGVIIGISAFDASSNGSQISVFLLPYLTHSVGAIVLLIVGNLIARFLERSVLIGAVNARLQYARFLSLGIKWLVLVLTAAMVLDHLEIGGAIVELAFGILFGGIVLTLALAVGLGSRDIVSRSLEKNVERPATEPLSGTPESPAPAEPLRHF